MKVLGIVGSLRKNGNTATLMREALAPMKRHGITTELLFLGDYEIESCRGCEGCQKTNECVINDDMQLLYPKIAACDAIILGSPTYFYSVTADMKQFIDRCYSLVAFHEQDRSVWMSVNEITGWRYGGVIAVCEQATEDNMGETSELMQYALESLGVRVVSTVKALHLFAEGEAKQDETNKFKAREAGEKLSKTLVLRNKLRDQYN